MPFPRAEERDEVQLVETPFFPEVGATCPIRQLFAQLPTASPDAIVIASGRARMTA
jgi:hypothetical protein